MVDLGYQMMKLSLCPGISQKVMSRRKSRSKNNLRFSAFAFLTFFAVFPFFFSQTGKNCQTLRGDPKMTNRQKGKIVKERTGDEPTVRDRLREFECRHAAVVDDAEVALRRS